MVHGRIAYQARAMTRAACWFQISADAGDPRGTVYLGLLYAFGWGVKPNPEKAIGLMQTASRAGDLFGKMYGSNFARYGIGIKPDPDLAAALMQEVARSKDGLAVVSQVQGWGATDNEVVGAVVGLFQAPGNCAPPRDYPGQRDIEEYHACEAQHKDAESQLYANVFHRPHFTIEHPEEIFPEFIPW